MSVLEDAFKKASQDPDVKEKSDDLFLTQKVLDSKAYAEFWDKMKAEIAPLIDEARKDAGTKGQ